MYLSICVLYTNDDDLMAWRMALPKTTAKHKVQIVALRTEQTDAVTEPVLNVVGDTELLTGLVWRYNDFSEQFDFAYLRNTVDTYARGEWILHIDADERLTTPHGDLWAFLEALHETDAPASYVSVYGIMDGVNKSGRADRYINANMRLHRKSAGLKWDGICHETLDKSAYDLGAFADSEIMLFHLGYNQGPEVQKQKAERNAKLLVREYTRNKCERNWDYLVKTFGYLNNNKK